MGLRKMLTVKIPACEYYDSEKDEFLYTKEQTLKLEHSLLSIAKWEERWEKPFLKEDEKSPEEYVDYIRCMTITQNVDPLIYRHLPKEVINQIGDYIDKKMTATWFREDQTKRPNKEIVTAEVIYYWMFSYGIPLDFQKVHLNKLMTLIRVFSEKNSPPNKMSRNEIYAQQRKLNAMRRKQHGKRG